MKWLWELIRDTVKHWVCRDELAALRRYEIAALLAAQWNGQIPNSAQTARWIMMVGQDTLGLDIDGFRRALQEGTADEYLNHYSNLAATLKKELESNTPNLK